MLALILLTSAVVVSVIAYHRYYTDIRDHADMQPNRWSWMIWSATTAVEAFTFDAVSTDFEKSFVFFVSAACCVAIMLVIWRRAGWKMPDASEFTCITASVLAVVLWQAYDQTLWAHLLAVAALPVAFYPTWKSAWNSPEKEDSKAWILWTIGDALTLALVLTLLQSKEELPYAIVEFVCHALVAGIVWWRTRSPRAACEGISGD